MSLSIEPLSLDAYRRAISVRDLTDPGQGPHSIQLLVDAAAEALSTAWSVAVRHHRSNPVVPVEDNYDRLRYPAEGIARDDRYTRYVSDRLLLRTQTSAMVPGALESLELTDRSPDWLLVCPGIVYRRDQIDRLHSGEPHQLDLWRIRRGEPLRIGDLHHMISCVVRAVLPGVSHRTTPADHPYTLDGLQIDVLSRGEWIEVGECGLAHPEVLAARGLPVPPHSGLAMGLGLDRILMLRKDIPDIRLLRARDPRIAVQMLDLKPYRSVSHMPAMRRDLSIVVTSELTPEELGDRVRSSLGARASSIESIEILSEVPYDALPPQAIARMGARPGQKNVLLRIVLRDLERTLTSSDSNQLRDHIYLALHQGDRLELAGEH